MGLRILVVEDNVVNRELVVDLLEAEGHAVVAAADGSELRARIRASPLPDVVLMDVQLPDADGVDLLKEIRADGGLRAVAVIAVTAHALFGDRERLLAAGFDGVFTKPIDTRTFCADIAILVAGRRRA